jgi:hypothetical protein
MSEFLMGRTMPTASASSHIPGGRGAIPIAALITVIFASPFSTAAQTNRIVAKFTCTTANLNPGAGEALKIDVLEWSSVADREKVLAALKDKGDSGVSNVLEAAHTVGFIWTGASLGYSVRYAHHVPLPDGGERIILATNVPLGRSNPWKATGQTSASDHPFTVIELRVNRGGVGEGKMSLTSKITGDDEGKTIQLESYDNAPVLLKMVKREPL